MKLYIAKGSTSCRKVLATVYHLNLPLELQTIQFYSEHFDKKVFARKNPNGMVPLLEDGDFLLWESTAIMQYLADKTPGSTLFPRNFKIRADISRWQSWALAHFGAACDSLIWENVLKELLEGGSPDPRKVDEATQGFLRSAAVLDHCLEGREFLVDDHVTLADFSVAATLGYAEPARMPWDEFSNIKKWYVNLETLDAWKKTAPSL